MEPNSETCNVTRLQWNTRFIERQSVSPFYTVENKKWYFQLHNTQNYYSDLEWNLLLIKDERREMFAKFVVTAYVKSEDDQLTLLVSKEITHRETCICTISQDTSPFNSKESTIAGKAVTFVFTFDFLIRRKGDDKSVQTSSELDGRPCLDRLSLDLQKLVIESSSSDVELKCGSRTFPAHRLILCARSEVLRAMLQSDMLENREGSVEIVDMDTDAFEVFLRYIYTGSLPELTVDIASPLYEAGDKYRLEALMKRCGDFLATNLTPESACEVLVLADAHNDEKLKEVALSYILDERIPDEAEDWLNFCDEHPKLGIEVLYRAYQQ